ncbi:hypothetical protein HY629_02540 [Candidatus Uhrbacteria bacterium]|nr:hypothetical protein [Candidatus Uhrbacteria bacterium]
MPRAQRLIAQCMSVGTGILLPLLSARADTANPQSLLGKIGDKVYAGGAPTFDVALASIINTLLALVGTVFFLLVLYAGYLWMTAQGNTEHVDKAKSILKNAVIGIAVIALAGVITTWLLGKLPGS